MPGSECQKRFNPIIAMMGTLPLSFVNTLDIIMCSDKDHIPFTVNVALSRAMVNG
jgi:hypothetical protein